MLKNILFICNYNTYSKHGAISSVTQKKRKHINKCVYICTERKWTVKCSHGPAYKNVYMKREKAEARRAKTFAWGFL